MPERPHRKLQLWQQAMDFVAEVYRMTERFPAGERYGLVSQMRRAAVSIPSNVAEGAARKTRKELRQFLYAVRGSISELNTQLEIALRLGYLTETNHHRLQDQLDRLSRLLFGLMASLPE